MFEEMTVAKQHTLPRQVWDCLTDERRAQAIRLMAQLAFNLIEAQTVAFIQEKHHVASNQAKDSP